MVRSLLVGGAAALTALTFAVAGCSTTLSVDESKVEETIRANLAPQITSEIEEVDCPADLKGAVGETMQCAMTVDGQQHTVEVTVSSVEGTTVNFNMRLVE